MDDLSALSERELDRLLTGNPPPQDGEALAGLAELFTELRLEYVEAPPRGVEDAHVAAMLEELRRAARTGELAGAAEPRTAPRPWRSSHMPRKRLALLTSALVLSAPLGAVALAAAGVSLPDAVRAPFEAVGIELPNQAEADEGKGGGESTPGGERGKESAARGEGNGRAAKDRATDQRGKREGTAGRAFGESTAADAKQNASHDGRGFGERTSEGAQGLGRQPSHPGRGSPPGEQVPPGQQTPPGQQIAPGQQTPPGQKITPGRPESPPGQQVAPGQQTPPGQQIAKGGAQGDQP